MFRANGSSTVVVFSHPNHELAIFGLLQSLRPRLVYLTDGGGEERVEQTREGLRSIDLLDHAHFLNYTEKSFYDALLDVDVTFYQGVADRVRSLLLASRPLRILCDAVEFYNPVHDMSLPVVRAALGSSERAEIFEVPLVYQKKVEDQSYEVQRMSEARRSQQIKLQLSREQLSAKARGRDQIYTILLKQMGPVISELPLAHLALEVVAPASSSLPKPNGDNVLRYETRAQLLLERGEIERKITYREHYLPIARSLWN